MALVLEYVEVEHRPVARWQLPYHLLDHFGRYVLDGRIFLFCDVANVLFLKHQLSAAVAPDEVQRLVDGNPRGPCLQRTLPQIVEVADVGDDADKRLLQHVADIFSVSDIACADCFQVGNIQGTELPHRTVVAVANLRCQALLVVAVPCMVHFMILFPYIVR